MAKYIEFKHTPTPPAEALAGKIEAAPYDHAEAVLKAFALLDIAEKRGILDILHGAIGAEDAIIDKVAGYANTPAGIHTMRNLLVLAKLFSSIDPDLLGEASKDLTASLVKETRKPRAGFFSTVARLFSGDTLRGLAIAMAALESVGRTARIQSGKLGARS
jgi:uncharacterized protein YjgD (DUF1641 family)